MSHLSNSEVGPVTKMSVLPSGADISQATRPFSYQQVVTFEMKEAATFLRMRTGSVGERVTLAHGTGNVGNHAFSGSGTCKANQINPDPRLA